MFQKPHRLTTKDVRYIQKQRNVVRTQHFGVLWIPQYANKPYHQISLYIAADTVKKASRRHAIKRPLLEHLQSKILPQQQSRLSRQSGKKFYKLFVFLNKKTVTASMLGDTKKTRDKCFADLAICLKKEREVVNKRLSLSL